jgi:pimeloyl-ACP methyl ester carboxylesterase
MADDIAALLKYLKIDKADVMGYSVGGETALRTAIQHPEIVNKLIIVSAAFKRDGWYPENLSGMSQMGPAAADAMKQTPMYQMYSQLAPKPEDWSLLFTKLGDLGKQEYDWSEDVKKIKSRTLIVVGDADAVRTSHVVEFFGLFGGGQHDAGWDGSGRPKNCELAILPGLTHYTIFNSPVLASTAVSFLDAKN